MAAFDAELRAGGVIQIRKAERGIERDKAIRDAFKKPGFSAPTEVRAIARERVGKVKASRPIVPKADRKPKYKSDPRDTES